MKYRLYARVASVVRRTEISACKPSRDFKFFQNASLDPGGVPIFEMFCSPPLGAVWVEKGCFRKKFQTIACGVSKCTEICTLIPYTMVHIP